MRNYKKVWESIKKYKKVLENIRKYKENKKV